MYKKIYFMGRTEPTKGEGDRLQGEAEDSGGE
jgi:hypothetical protein